VGGNSLAFSVTPFMHLGLDKDLLKHYFTRECGLTALQDCLRLSMSNTVLHELHHIFGGKKSTDSRYFGASSGEAFIANDRNELVHFRLPPYKLLPFVNRNAFIKCDTAQGRVTNNGAAIEITKVPDDYVVNADSYAIFALYNQKSPNKLWPVASVAQGVYELRKRLAD
jgi:hypothetical protein